MPSVEDELRRLAAHVRLWISRREMRVKDIEANLGWKPGHMSKIMGGHSKMKVEDFFLILAAIQVEPVEFFHDFYRLGSGHEFPMAVSDRLRQPGARSLAEATEQFRRHEPITLAAGNMSVEYIDRLKERISLLLTIRELRKSDNVLLVFGQPRCGKSTMILAALASDSSYEPVIVDLLGTSKPSAFTILVLMSARLAEIVEMRGEDHDGVVWEASRLLMSAAGIQLPPTSKLELSENLRCVAVSDLLCAEHLNCARWLVSALVHAVAMRCKLTPVIVLSNLSYVSGEPAKVVAGLAEAGIPEALVLIELPFSARYDPALPPFASFVVPNVQVSAGFSGDLVPDEGFRFMSSVIDSLLSSDVFGDDARKLMFRTSGGSVGDLLALVNKACEHAIEVSSRVLDVNLAFAMKEMTMEKLDAKLSEDDRSALTELIRNPFVEIEPARLRHLLDLRVLMPQATENSVWLAVHPLVRELMAKKKVLSTGAESWQS